MLDLEKHCKVLLGVNGEGEHSSKIQARACKWKSIYKITVVEAEILCRGGMTYNSGKVGWGHTVLSLDCQIEESSLFFRLLAAPDNFASGE